MPVITLTDLTIRSLKEPGLYLDQKTPSFGIRVGKNRKTWIVIHPNRSKEKFGSYPDLALADARKEAKRLLSTKPEPKPSTINFEKGRDLFIEDNYKGAKPRTKKEAKRLLEKHCKDLYSKQLAELTDADIQRQLDKLADRPSEQLHTYRVLRCFLRWATRPPRRYIKHSPMEGYEAPSQDRKGTRILSDKELVRLWKGATGAFGAMVKLLILWGTRNSETAGIRRDWVVDGVLTIPGTHTKNKRDHSIPLLPMAQNILDEQPIAGSYFFPGRWDTATHFHEGSWGKPKAELVETTGVKNWQLRDIRRTFRSTLARLGVPRDLAEVLINHAPPVLDEIYDRYDRLEEKRAALQKYEAHLQALFTAAERLAA